MRLPADVDELELIAEYHTACRALRSMGWGSLVFGLINVGLGVGFALSIHPINAVLALIGMFLLASGIWCLMLPGAEGVIANGIGLILVGLWNIFVTILNLAAGAPPQVWWAIFGVFLIGNAVQCFRKYARFSAALRHPVSADERAMMDKLVKTVLKSNVKKDEDIVAFQTRGFLQQKDWLGLLGDNGAVFADKLSHEILVAHKEEIRIEPHGKVLLGSTLKASVKIKDQKWEALIAPQSFDRFRDWKFSADEDSDRETDQDYDADEREPETGVRAKDDRVKEPPTRSTDIEA